jgi:hypothetical protein
MTVYFVISLPIISYIYTVIFDRMFGASPAKNIVYTPYMTVNLVISLPELAYIYTPFMTVYLVLPLPKISYIHCIDIWFWPPYACGLRLSSNHMCVMHG